MNLYRLVRRLRLSDPFPDTDRADVASGATAPQPSEEIKRRQLAVLERHVIATRARRGVWRNS